MVSSTLSARLPVPRSARVTSEIAVIGVTRLMRTATSKAVFWSTRLCSFGSGSAPGSGGPSARASDSGSPNRM